MSESNEVVAPVEASDVRDAGERPRGLSPAGRAALLGAMVLAGSSPAVERRKKIDAANHWRISETDFNAQAIARAQAKRERKKALRASRLDTRGETNE